VLVAGAVSGLFTKPHLRLAAGNQHGLLVKPGPVLFGDLVDCRFIARRGFVQNDHLLAVLINGGLGVFMLPVAGCFDDGETLRETGHKIVSNEFIPLTP
jgi:hypothetical protein